MAWVAVGAAVAGGVVNNVLNSGGSSSGGGSSSSGGGSSGTPILNMSPTQLAFLLKQYSDAQSAAGTANSAYTKNVGAQVDLINKIAGQGGDYSTAIAGLLKTLGASTSTALPSTTAFQPGDYNAYIAAASKGDLTPTLTANAATDRSNMLAQEGVASDAAGRRVVIDPFSQAGGTPYNPESSADLKARLLTSMNAGVDRANALTASQSAASGLKTGIADSTAQQTIANNLARQFASTYAGNVASAETTGQTEFNNNYSTYLTGQNSQVDQNAKVANSEINLLNSLGGISNNSTGAAVTSVNNEQNNLLKALAASDSAFTTNKTANNTATIGALGPLLTALTGVNSQTLNAGGQLVTDAGNMAKTATTNAGTQLSKLGSAAWGGGGFAGLDNLANTGIDALTKAISKGITGGLSGSGGTSGSTGNGQQTDGLTTTLQDGTQVVDTSGTGLQGFGSNF